MRSTTGVAARRRPPASTTACGRYASSTRRTRSRAAATGDVRVRFVRPTPRRALASGLASGTPRETTVAPVLVAGLLLGREPEPLLEDEPHLLRGRAPERAAGGDVRIPDLPAHLVHRRVRLVLRRDVDRLGADLGRLARRRMRALEPATDLVPVLVEEHDDRNGLIAVVQEGVPQVGFLVAEEDPQVAALHRLADVRDQR